MTERRRERAETRQQTRAHIREDESVSMRKPANQHSTYTDVNVSVIIVNETDDDGVDDGVDSDA